MWLGGGAFGVEGLAFVVFMSRREMLFVFQQQYEQNGMTSMGRVSAYLIFLIYFPHLEGGGFAHGSTRKSIMMNYLFQLHMS